MRELTPDQSPEATKVLASLGLGNRFKAVKDKAGDSFYSEDVFTVAAANRTLASIDEMKEKFIKPLDAEFGEKMLHICQGTKKETNYAVVCKYMTCPFKMMYVKTKIVGTDGQTSDTLAFTSSNMVKTHSIIAHRNKDLKCRDFL